MIEHYPGFSTDLQLVIERTSHKRYQELTDPANPSYHLNYVQYVREMAAQFRGETKPSLWQETKTLTKAIANFIGSGFELATQQQQQDRLHICSDCEWFSREDIRCMKCGCFLKPKVAMASEKCPIDKWGALTGPDAKNESGCVSCGTTEPE